MIHPILKIEDLKVKTRKNKAETTFRLIGLINGNYVVLKLCGNYCGHVKGGVQYKWRVVPTKQRMTNPEFQELAKNGLPLEDAEKLFNKKIQGKEK